MRAPLAPALGLLLALALAGCTLLKEPEEKPYEGKAFGYDPTAAFLKVNVRDPEGRIKLFDFDRRDWYTAELARRVDHREITDLTIQGKARDTLGEVLVLDVLDPGTLSGLRYDRMDATPEARQQMDAEHDELLRDLTEPLPEPAPPTPDLTVLAP